MKIEIDYQYPVQFKEPRHARWSEKVITDKIEVQLDEFNEKEAPLVHVVFDETLPGRDASYSHKYCSKFGGVEGACMIRNIKGQNYASRMPVGDIAKWRGHEQHDPFVGTVGYGLPGYNDDYAYRNRFFQLDFVHKEQLSYGAFIDANPNAKRLTSFKGQVSKLIEMAADRLIVVDGFVYEPVNEPVVAVYLIGKTIKVCLEEAVSPDGDWLNKGAWLNIWARKARFPLDQYDRAIEYAEDLAGEYQLELEVKGQVYQATSDYLNFSGEQEFLYAELKRATKQIEDALSHLPKEVGMVGIQLAHEIALHDRLTTEIIETGRRLLVRMARWQHPSFIVDPSKEDYFKQANIDKKNALGNWKENVDHLKRAFRLWDSRIGNNREWVAESFESAPLMDYPNRVYEITSKFDLAYLVHHAGFDVSELEDFDPERDALLVVENMETRNPSLAILASRNDYGASQRLFSGENSKDQSEHLMLVHEYLKRVKGKAEIASHLKPNAAPVYRA